MERGADVAYEQALEVLQAMFANIDVEVIQSVLHSHRGHMERTVESLLLISGDASAAPSAAHDASATEGDEELARRLQVRKEALKTRELAKPILPPFLVRARVTKRAAHVGNAG